MIDSPSPDNRDRFYLSHMLECIESIERYTASAPDLDSDELTQDAILRKLQLLTESSKRVSVIHIERILPIVRNDIPTLKSHLQTILASPDFQ